MSDIQYNKLYKKRLCHQKNPGENSVSKIKGYFRNP